MAYAYPKTSTFGNDRPNWLSSEVGLQLKTYMIKANDVAADANGKKIVKSGSVFKVGSTVVGLIFPQLGYDVTDGDLECSVMVGGRVWKNRLPETISEGDAVALEGRGIIFDTAPEVTRP